METAPAKIVFAEQLIQLPERIQNVVENARAGMFALALKTAYKPNATIPLIWLVLTSEALLLCNTHSTRGLWGRYSRSTLPPLLLDQTSTARPYFELHANTGLLTLTLPENLLRGEIDRFLGEYKRLGLGGRP